MAELPSVRRPEPPFLAALRGRPTGQRPIWIMRQAGRYLPEYRAVRERVSFRQLCREPELACEVTLQPIRRFGFDAAILFSDILTPLEPMGAEFRFDEGGPRLERPLRDEDDVDRLQVVDPREELGFVADAIRLIKRSLPDGTPLIGFAGAPVTLAAYLVEGGGSQDFRRFKAMLYSRPDLVERLLDLLADQVGEHLVMQAEAGADAVQLFDTWAGILVPEDYRRLALPRVRRILERVAETGVPRIFFARGGASILPLAAAAGADALGIDWTVGLDEALRLVGRRPLQGNLDPLVLLGSQDEIRRRTRAVLRAGDAAPGHVFNLGHGIVPETPIAAVETLVATVREHGRETS
ncbi:MAG: uroporphyrinogen decarboxylase [Candidatus Krumholzibacteriia bacterium]